MRAGLGRCCSCLEITWLEHTSRWARYHQILVISADLDATRTFSTEFSQTWRCDHSKAEYFIFVLDNSHQNLTIGSKVITNFVKISTKYLKALLTLDLPWSCAIKYYSSRRESILSLYKPFSWTPRWCQRMRLDLKYLIFEPPHNFLDEILEISSKNCQNELQPVQYFDNLLIARFPLVFYNIHNIACLNKPF